MKIDDIKKLQASLDNKEIQLEDLLLNNEFMQPTIKLKFPKFSKYFIQKEWINKLIHYSLYADPKIPNFKTYSHNSCEILALVKNSNFIKEIMLVENNDENNLEIASYPYLDKIFEYANIKANQVKKEIQDQQNDNKMEVEKEDDLDYSDEMINGYFERIFNNLVLKAKKKLFAYLFRHKPESMDNLILLAEYDEHFLNCLVSILIAKEDSEFGYYQETFLLKYIKTISSIETYSIKPIKIFFERLFLERDLYIRYFSKNKTIAKAVFEMLIQKQTVDSSPQNNVKKSIVILKQNCNPLIIEVLIKLSQNLIIDLEKKLDSLKTEEKKLGGLFNLKIKSKYADDPKTTTPNNWHTTVNNLIELNINGHKFKKPREIILNTIGDYDKELESDDEEDEEDCFDTKPAVKNSNKEPKIPIYIDSNEDQKFLIGFLSKSLSILMNNFNSLSFNKQTYFGIDSLKKVEYANNIVEILIYINFLQLIINEKEGTMTSNVNISSNSNNSLITASIQKQTSNNSLTHNLGENNSNFDSNKLKQFTDHNNKIKSIDLNKDLVLNYFNSIFNCFIKFSENSLMHKEVEYLATFLANRYCPDMFVEIFTLECNFFEKLIVRNLNLSVRTEIPSNIANMCEVLVRFFLTENTILQIYLEQNIVLCAWFDKYFYPLYEIIKQILLDPDKKVNQVAILEENEEINEDSMENEKITSKLDLLNKPILHEKILELSKNATLTKESSLDLKSLKKRTESAIFKNTMNIKINKCTNTKTTVFVDEMQDTKNSKINLNNSFEEFFNNDEEET